jgi:hypothetical protein
MSVQPGLEVDPFREPLEDDDLGVAAPRVDPEEVVDSSFDPGLGVLDPNAGEELPEGGQELVTEYEYDYGDAGTYDYELGESGAWPVQGTVWGVFGEDRGTHAHGGIDIGAGVGTPIRSPLSGTVIEVGYEAKGWGKYVRVQHSDGTVTLYAHMDQYAVKQGQRVNAGQWVGNVGETGRTSGPHLHFEVYQNGQRVDPLPWLNSLQSGAAKASGAGVGKPANNGKYTYEQLVGLAKGAGFNHEEARMMAAISLLESDGGDPNAYNGEGADDSYGLWQFNLRYPGWEVDRRLSAVGITDRNQLFNPKVNARAAYWLYKEQGFGAWSVYAQARRDLASGKYG